MILNLDYIWFVALSLWAVIFLFYIAKSLAKIIIYFQRLETKLDKIIGEKNEKNNI